MTTAPFSVRDWTTYAIESIDNARLDAPAGTQHYVFFLDADEAPECDDYNILEITSHYERCGYVNVRARCIPRERYAARAVRADRWGRYCPRQEGVPMPKELVEVMFSLARHERLLRQPRPSALARWFYDLFPKWGN